jgi:hypothetical protein
VRPAVKYADLNAKTRVVLDGIIRDWIRKQPALIACMSVDEALRGVIELIQGGAIALTCSGSPTDPRSTWGIALTDAGQAFFSADNTVQH